MRIDEVLEIIENKIIVEEESEYPDEDIIKTLKEVGHLVSMIDEVEEKPYCEFCGESLKECSCDCPKCDKCDECTCCNSEEDYELTDEEYLKLYFDLVDSLLSK